MPDEPSEPGGMLQLGDQLDTGNGGGPSGSDTVRDGGEDGADASDAAQAGAAEDGTVLGKAAGGRRQQKKKKRASGGKRAGAGRPKKKPEAADNGFSEEEQEELDELREEAPEEVEQLEAFLLSREDLTFILQAGFLTISNAVLDRLKREGVTPAESERWGRITWLVYHKYLENIPAGMVVHGLMTAAILMQKRPLRDPTWAERAEALERKA